MDGALKNIKHFLATSGPSLLAYWAMTFYGLAAFSLVLVVEVGPAPELIMILMQFAAVTIVGQLIGHVMGYLRLRLPFVLMGVGMCCGVQTLSTPALAAVPYLAVIWFMAPFTLASGFLAIRHRKEIFGAWIPLMYSVGASVILINIDGDKLSRWMAGDKYAVWNVVNLTIIAGALLLFVIYMVTRQAQSLSMWQDAALQPSQRPTGMGPMGDDGRKYNPRARISCMTWIVIAVLAAFVTIGTAAVAPYLFRTAEQDQGDGKGKGGQGDGKGQQRDGKGQPRDGDGKGQQNQGDGQQSQQPDPDMDKVSEGVKRMAQQGFDLLVMLLILLVALILIYFIFWRPARRMATIRHLESPAWAVPSTQRIKDLWRRALISLHDVGVEPRRTESVEEMADRAEAYLTKKYGAAPSGLQEAAEIYSRVQYSIGVGSEDLIRMAASVDLLTEYVDNRLTWWQQLGNLYGGLKDDQ